MKLKSTVAALGAAVATLGAASAQSKPSVVVTIENTAPYNGGFLTPVWVGFHNGGFDTYDRNAPANLLPVAGSVAMERLAEDGNTGPLTADFASEEPLGVDGTIRSNGPVPPIGPGQIVSRLFEVEPANAQYFSYASMIIPSNDAFIANGNPRAHQVFDDRGQFVGGSFYVSGDEVLDAGTEVNDEVPANTAFFGQAGPNIGLTESGTIVDHVGLLPREQRGILAASRFMDADFEQADYDTARIKLTFLDKAAPVLFSGELDSTFAIPGSSSPATGRSFFFLDDDGESLIYIVFASDLTGPLTAAHLHLAPKLQTGPVTLPLNIAFGSFAFGRVRAEDVVGPLASPEDIDNVIAEMVSGATYVNLHTAQNPAGEIRGQVHLANF